MSPGALLIVLLCVGIFWYARRHFNHLMDEHDIVETPTRKLLVLTMALAVTLCAGKLMESLFA